MATATGLPAQEAWLLSTNIFWAAMDVSKSWIHASDPHPHRFPYVPVNYSARTKTLNALRRTSEGELCLWLCAHLHWAGLGGASWEGRELRHRARLGAREPGRCRRGRLQPGSGGLQLAAMGEALEGVGVGLLTRHTSKLLMKTSNKVFAARHRP